MVTFLDTGLDKCIYAFFPYGEFNRKLISSSNTVSYEMHYLKVCPLMTINIVKPFESWNWDVVMKTTPYRGKCNPFREAVLNPPLRTQYWNEIT